MKTPHDKRTGQEMNLWGWTKTTFTATHVFVCWLGDLVGFLKRQQGGTRLHRLKKTGSEQWMCSVSKDRGAQSRVLYRRSLQKKKKNPDYTEKYRFKCLTFIMRGSFSSFYLVHPLFIYLWSVLCCLELSRWGGLLRLEEGAPAWQLWEGLLELLCICMEWWAWCQDMDHSFTPSNEYRLRTG